MANARTEYQVRTTGMELRRADAEKAMIIEGYFIRFNEPTELYPGFYEVVLPEALENFDERDIRALWNHNSQYVLGRSLNGTLEMRVDDVGLWARITLPDTSYARDLHTLVSRGDVNQCSFGFNIIDEDPVDIEKGLLFELRKIELHEISVVTFPAYPMTSVEARTQLTECKKILVSRKKEELLKKLQKRRCEL